MKVLTILVFALSLAVGASSAHAFEKGSTTLSLQGGIGQAYGGTYVIVGARGGYFFLPGVQAGLGVQHWFGGPPRITQISPYAEAALTVLPAIAPYIGAFYRYTLIREPSDDHSSIGLRGGIYFLGSSRVNYYAGVVNEWQLGPCARDCSWMYPEFGIVLRF